jgi:hypothetical protein
MGLFFDVLNSINDPKQGGSVDQLSGVMDSIQQLTGKQGMNATATQALMSALSGPLKSALQQQSTTGGGLNDLIGQFAGGNPSVSAVQSLFPPQMQQQMIQGVAQKTGMSPSLLQSVLPTLLPAVMGILNMGRPNVPGARGGNPILNTFLDSDRDGDTDLGDVFKFAGRFLNPAR